MILALYQVHKKGIIQFLSTDYFGLSCIPIAVINLSNKDIFSKNAFRYLKRFAVNGAVLFTTSSFKVCECQDFAFASLAKVAKISTLNWVFLISKI